MVQCLAAIIQAIVVGPSNSLDFLLALPNFSENQLDTK